MDVEVPPSGERAVDDGVLEHHAGDRPGREWLAPHVEAGQRAVPAVGATVVVSMPMVVDLPAPFGPSRPNTSPGRRRS